MKSITISQAEYDDLLRDSRLLSALVGAGVNNWEGYSYAIEYFYEMYPEYDD